MNTTDKKFWIFALVIIFIVYILINGLSKRIDDLEERLINTHETNSLMVTNLYNRIAEAEQSIRSDIEVQSSLFSDTQTEIVVEDDGIFIDINLSIKEIKSDEHIFMTIDSQKYEMTRVDNYYALKYRVGNEHTIAPVVTIESVSEHKQEAFPEIWVNSLLEVWYTSEWVDQHGADRYVLDIMLHGNTASAGIENFLEKHAEVEIYVVNTQTRERMKSSLMTITENNRRGVPRCYSLDLSEYHALEGE